MNSSKDIRSNKRSDSSMYCSMDCSMGCRSDNNSNSRIVCNQDKYLEISGFQQEDRYWDSNMGRYDTQDLHSTNHQGNQDPITPDLMLPRSRG